MANAQAYQEFNLGEPQCQAPPPLPFLPVPGTFAHEWLREGSTAHSEGRLASDLRRAYAQFGKPTSGQHGTPAGTVGTSPDKIFLEALSLSNELCFLTVLPNDPRIVVVHGLAVYAESFGAANPYQGRLLAFMGERAACTGGMADKSLSSSLPHLLVAPTADAARALFGSTRRRVARRETLAAFYDDAAAREHGSSPSDSWSLLHPAPSAEDDDDAEEAFLPKLAYIPRRWAPYFLGGPSPYEALRVAEHLVRTTLLGNEVGAAEPLLRWFRSACCRRSDAPHYAYRSAASVEWTPLLADHVSGAVRAWALERVGRLLTVFDSTATPRGDGSRIDGGSGVAALPSRPPPPIVVAEDVGGGEAADSIVVSGGMDQRSSCSEGNAVVCSVSDDTVCNLQDDDSRCDPGIPVQGQRNAMNASLGFVGSTSDVEGNVNRKRGGERPPSSVEGPNVEVNVSHERREAISPSNVEGHVCDVDGNANRKLGAEVPLPNAEAPKPKVKGIVNHDTVGGIPRCTEVVTRTSTAVNGDVDAAWTDCSASVVVSADKKPAAQRTVLSLQQKPKISFTRHDRLERDIIIGIIVPPSVAGDAKRAFNMKNGTARIRVQDETNCRLGIAGKGHQDWDPRCGDKGIVLVVSGTERDVKLAESMILNLVTQWTQAKSEPRLGQGSGAPDKARGRNNRLTSASKSAPALLAGQRKRRNAEDYEDAESTRYRLRDVGNSERGRISPNSKRRRNAQSGWHKCFDLKDFFPCRGKIDDRSIGRLIGRRGSKLDELMEVTGSTILVCSREMTIDISAANEERFNNTVDYMKNFCRSLNERAR